MPIRARTGCPSLRATKTGGLDQRSDTELYPGGVATIAQSGTNWLSVLTDSKNRRLPPAVYARRKEERKNEKLNLSTYIVPREF